MDTTAATLKESLPNMLAHYICPSIKRPALQDMIQGAVINSMDEDRHNITLQALEIKDQKQRDNWNMKTIQATAIAYGKRCKQMAEDLKDFILQIFPQQMHQQSPSNHRPHRAEMSPNYCRQHRTRLVFRN